MEGNITSPNLQLGEDMSFTILQVLSIFDDSTLESLSTDFQFLDNEEIYKNIIQRVIEFKNTGIDTTKILEVPSIEIKEKMINVLTDKTFISSLNTIIVENDIFQKYFDERIDHITQFNEIVNVNNLVGVAQPIINNINNLSNQDINNLNIKIIQDLSQGGDLTLNIENLNTIVNEYKDKINYNYLQTKFSETIDNNNFNTITKLKNEVFNNTTSLKNEIFNNGINELTTLFSEVSSTLTDIKNIEGVKNFTSLINNNTSDLTTLNKSIFNSSETTNLTLEGDKNINNVGGVTLESIELISKNLITSLGSSDVLNMDVVNKEEVVNNNFENVYNTINNIKNEVMEIISGQMMEQKSSSQDVQNRATTTPISTNTIMPDVLSQEQIVNVYPKMKDVRPLPIFHPIGGF